MKRTIEDYLNHEVKEYSISVIKDRALPSVLDGLKPVQRKIIHTAEKTAKTFKTTKALVGAVLDVGGYDKGDQSVEDAITNLVQNFAGANNITWLDGSGTFGSRFVPKGAAAGRYTKTKISNNFKLFFVDEELHEYTPGRDEQNFEPNYYLPVIPTILINGIKGIAVGFDCEFQPYSIADIVKNVKAELAGKSQKRMKPFFNGFKGTIQESVGDHTWIMYGTVEFINSTTMKVTEVPVGVSREKYIEHLNKLLDQGKIKDFEDQCSKDGFKFSLQLTRDNMAKFQKMSTQVMMKQLGLSRNLKERLNCIGEDNKLKQFKSPNDIIKYFVKFRLGLMDKRKVKKLLKLEENRLYLEHKSRFIQKVLDGEFKFTEFKSKKDMVKALDWVAPKGYVDRLLAIPVYTFTEEEQEKIRKEIARIVKEMDYYEKVKPGTLFSSDIDELLNQL